MKVLKTCLSKSWGGLEMYALQTVQQLLKRGIETELLCYPGSRLHNEAVNCGIKVHTAKFSGYFHPLKVKEISKLIRKNNYNIIHCGASKDLWLIVPSLKFFHSDIPLILSKQMGSYIVKKDYLHKILYKRVNYALAISKVIAQNLIDTTPLTQEKVLLVHNAIDTNKFDPAKIDRLKVRKEFNIGDNELLIGMMARFSPGKGHEEFLLAAQHLSKMHENIKFMIVGEPSKGEDNYGMLIKSLSEKYELTYRIIFTGFRNDTPEILAAMDIFVFPSHAEAFGIALAEALSMGKPSVCSNSDGVLDIAVNEVTSYLFEKQNWNDLADKLDMLIKFEEKRIEFGKAARKRAQELFDLEVFTDKLLDVYNKTLK